MKEDLYGGEEDKNPGRWGKKGSPLRPARSKIAPVWGRNGLSRKSSVGRAQEQRPVTSLITSKETGGEDKSNNEVAASRPDEEEIKGKQNFPCKRKVYRAERSHGLGKGEVMLPQKRSLERT